ncbi:ABC transporter permease [Epilithonimonas sp. UC225_85]|uniref:ABC transporter permease n=1 Tax=Epilithonimonas sp. UC225_85 TaxID=3350167 RepID=UPI0036D37047
MSEIKIYEAANQNKTFIKIIGEMFKDLVSSAGLAQRLFIRDKNAEYRQSIFGILWALITPLANALIWVFLSASGAVNVSGTGIPYALYVFLGTMLWSIFSESVSMPLTQTNASKALISKINFPKEAILLSGFYKVIFNSAIKFLIIIGVLLIFGYYPTFQFLLFIGTLILLILFGISLGLIITPIGLLYTDIGKLIPVVLPFLMYLTPVVYVKTKVSTLQSIIDANPLTPLINTCRNMLTRGNIENPTYLFTILIVTIVIMFVGWLFYRISIPIVVERM